MLYYFDHQNMYQLIYSIFYAGFNLIYILHISYIHTDMEYCHEMLLRYVLLRENQNVHTTIMGTKLKINIQL